MLLKENIKGETAKYITNVEYEIKEGQLCFHFTCEDSLFYSAGSNYNDDIYNGDVCEVFIKTEKGPYYYEIEIAPNGTEFLGLIYNDGIETILMKLDNNFISSKVEINGNNYNVDIYVPLDKIGYKPLFGIEFNAYRIETRGGKETYLMALYPTMCGSYHKPESFKKIN